MPSIKEFKGITLHYETYLIDVLKNPIFPLATSNVASVKFK